MQLQLLLALALQLSLAELLAGQPVAGTHLLRPRRQTGSSSSKQQKANKQWEQECLATHNKWRRLHNAPELSFDKKIAQFAQKRADHIARSDGAEFRHPDDLIYGENLAWHSRAATSCADLIKMWYDEVELYDFRAAAFSHETGHFTQLVWKETRSVGCAKALSSGPKGGVYLVCNYDPPGNFLGEAGANVERRLIKPVAAPTTTSTTTTSTTTTSTTTTTTTTTRPPTTRPPTTKAPTTKAPAKKKSKRKSTTKAPPVVSTARAPRYPVQAISTTTLAPSSVAPTATTTIKPPTSTSTSTKRPASGNKKKSKKKKKKGGKKKRKKATTTVSPQQQ